MRLIACILTSSVSGVVASLLLVRFLQGDGRVIRTNRLEVCDDEGRARMTLGVDNAQSAAITILSRDGNEAIRVGIARDGETGLLLMKNKTNSLFTAVAHPVHGSTLTLGDAGSSRMVIGAIPSDVPRLERSADWGLEIRGANSSLPIVSINVHDAEGANPGGAMIRIADSSGIVTQLPVVK